MNILAFESSFSTYSIFLKYNNNSSLIKDKKNPAENMLDDINNMIKELDANLTDIDYILTSKGPGGFTSVRISAAIAMGFVVSGYGDKVLACDNMSLIAFKSGKADCDILLKSVLNNAYYARFNDYNMLDEIKNIEIPSYSKQENSDLVSCEIDIDSAMKVNYPDSEDLYNFFCEMQGKFTDNLMPVYVRAAV